MIIKKTTFLILNFCTLIHEMIDKIYIYFAKTLLALECIYISFGIWYYFYFPDIEVLHTIFFNFNYSHEFIILLNIITYTFLFLLALSLINGKTEKFIIKKKTNLVLFQIILNELLIIYYVSALFDSMCVAGHYAFSTIWYFLDLIKNNFLINNFIYLLIIVLIIVYLVFKTRLKPHILNFIVLIIVILDSLLLSYFFLYKFFIPWQNSY